MRAAGRDLEADRWPRHRTLYTILTVVLMIEIAEKSVGHLTIECTSELDYLDEIVDGTEAFLKPLITDDEFAYRIVLLLTEAVTNAMEHGNALDAAKHVWVDLKILPERVTICVEDQGGGFDPATVANPITEENLLNDSGRGLFFIEQIADEVRYEKGGRRIRIQFNRPTD